MLYTALNAVRDVVAQGGKVLFVATGALLSPLTVLQKESIPCVAHAVVFEYEE